MAMRWSRAAGTPGQTPTDIGIRAVKVAVSGVVFACDAAVGAVVRSRRRGWRSTGVVLMYHDVPASQRARFGAQCDAIARLGVPTDVADMHSPADGRWRVAWTFDDAYRSFADEAVPEMAARGIPSTVFVPSRWICNTAEPETSGPGLTHEQIAALPPSVHIASHSRSHPRLPDLDDAALTDELVGSRTDLEGLIGRPVNLLAFPFGDHDARVDAAARAAGYDRCYGIVPSEAVSGDSFVVGRVQVDPSDWPIEVRLKVLGAYRWMAWWMRSRATGRT